ncbi:hypothetical protein [Streptomyces alfalfae]
MIMVFVLVGILGVLAWFTLYARFRTGIRWEILDNVALAAVAAAVALCVCLGEWGVAVVAGFLFLVSVGLVWARRSFERFARERRAR